MIIINSGQNIYFKKNQLFKNTTLKKIIGKQPKEGRGRQGFLKEVSHAGNDPSLYDFSPKGTLHFSGTERLEIKQESAVAFSWRSWGGSRDC